VLPDESEAAETTRAERRAWLAERGYEVMDVSAEEIEADVGKVLDRLDEHIAMA
jgi:very-short-patch-repair endonuclease